MKIIFLMGLLFSMQVLSATTYKCSQNGVMSYQYRPCDGASQQTTVEEKKLDKVNIDAGEKFEEGLILSPIYIKKDYVCITGDQWFVYKVTVTNNTDSERKVFLTYNAIDNDEFKIDNILLNGTVSPHSSKTLTGDSRMSVGSFQRIQKWVLDK